MTERSVTHASFTVERTYDAPPARVFAAWAQPEQKARWFSCHDQWKTVESAMDFSVGGREISRLAEPDGTMHAVESRYHDIVPDQRIVYTYGMDLDDARISVSLVTVELEPAGGGTRLVFTEQGAFFDGFDVAGREEGTGIGLDRLAAMLEAELAAVG